MRCYKTYYGFRSSIYFNAAEKVSHWLYRAARLIDELEVMGVIGKHEGSKPRQVIMSKEEAYRFVKKLSESKR